MINFYFKKLTNHIVFCTSIIMIMSLLKLPTNHYFIEEVRCIIYLHHKFCTTILQDLSRKNMPFQRPFFFLEALKGKVSYDFCSQYLRNGVTFQYSTYNRKKDSFSYFQTRAAQSKEHAYEMNIHLAYNVCRIRNTTKINDCYNNTIDV